MNSLFDWCVFHNSLASANPGRCFMVSVGHGDETDCEFAVMRLVPDDALVIERVKGMGLAEWTSTAEYIKGLVAPLLGEVERLNLQGFS